MANSIQLDLCSPTASYAIHIPILSSRYNPLRQAILALSASQRQDDTDLGLAAALVEAAFNDLGSDMYSRREEAIATRHLLYIAQILPLPIQQWRPLLADRFSGFDELGIHGFLGGIRGAACWLMLRFGQYRTSSFAFLCY